MSRVKVNLPASFQFSANYTVRVSDLNYGNHLGNDRLLSILHQARIDFISHLCNGSELDFFGVSLIMADVVINYQNEAFLNDLIPIDMALANPTKAGFDLYYKVSCENKNIAAAKAGMVCFDYNERKIVTIPDKLLAIIPDNNACVSIK